MIEPAIRDEFVTLRARGMSIRSIARALKISASTVWRWNVECAENIARVRTSVIDLALNEFGADRLQRLKAAAEFHRLLRERLKTDLASGGAIDKVKMDFYLKVSHLLNKEDVPVFDDGTWEEQQEEEEAPEITGWISNIPRPERRQVPDPQSPLPEVKEAVGGEQDTV